MEPELDTFSLILPLPYRIAVIFVLGVWAWGVNLHYLSLIKIVRHITYLHGNFADRVDRTFRRSSNIPAGLLRYILLISGSTSSLRSQLCP